MICGTRNVGLFGWILGVMVLLGIFADFFAGIYSDYPCIIYAHIDNKERHINLM